MIGFDVLHRCTVGDNRGRLAESLRQALGRSDLVVLIGGLGPTGDDLTKETAAEVCGKHLVMDAESRSQMCIRDRCTAMTDLGSAGIL